MADAKGRKVRCRVAASGFRIPIQHTIRVSIFSPLGRAAQDLDDAMHVHWVGDGPGAWEVLYVVDSLGVAWLRERAAEIGAAEPSGAILHADHIACLAEAA